jgi:hypothetical protein
VKNQIFKKENMTTVSSQQTKSIKYLSCPGTLYTGAFHGIAGILYMLIESMKMVQPSAEIPSLIKNTLDRLLLIIEEKGCLPRIEG